MLGISPDCAHVTFFSQCSELVATVLVLHFFPGLYSAGMGTTEKILKNRLFYHFTLFLCKLKEEIQRY